MKQRRYAEGTKVLVSSSRLELEQLLERHGASQIQITRDAITRQAVLVCRLAERCIRFEIKLDKPRLSLRQSCDSKCHSVDQREREAWRRLVLITKAKLELVANGESSVEREFLADIMLPDGNTVHGALGPMLAKSYADGSMPKLLMAAKSSTK